LAHGTFPVYVSRYTEYELAAAEKVVHDLLEHGADTTVTDIDGRTPLMMAVIPRVAHPLRFAKGGD
jgi:hypothetical protein